MSDIRITPGSKLELIRPVLRAWFGIIREYLRECRYPPYYYSSFERVNCGLLAAALWRARMPTLQELEVDRYDSENPGRVDLFFRHDVDFYVEAKMNWQYPDASWGRQEMVESLRTRLDVAVRGFDKYKIPSGCRRLAVVVASVGMPSDFWNDSAKWRGCLRGFTAAVREVGSDSGFAAWYLPKGTERWPECEGTDGCFYPAVAIAGKEVRRRASK
jgi:hypothetical protein